MKYSLSEWLMITYASNVHLVFENDGHIRKVDINTESNLNKNWMKRDNDKLSTYFKIRTEIRVNRKIELRVLKLQAQSSSGGV